MTGKLCSGILLMVLITSCATGQGSDLLGFLAEYGNDRPVPSKFNFCYAHGCRKVISASISESDWEKIREIFLPSPETPARERRMISWAIGSLESVVGKMTGTHIDVGGSFTGSLRNNQLDCVDETINTSTYLTMMKNDGLILFHELSEPASRGYFIWGWPHTTAVIKEKSSGQHYAVDSWFFDNGTPPLVIPLRDWIAGRF